MMAFQEHSNSATAFSLSARARLLSLPGEPVLYADWERAVFVHYEVDPVNLQSAVPFELDLREGRAYVSLVAFTMRGLRPRIGGKLGAWVLKPISTHHFLNVRTYVRRAGETGIYFLAEWLSNPLSVCLGPSTFGLPYRFGKLKYGHCHERGDLSGHITENSGPASVAYRAELKPPVQFEPCARGSLDEYLMERYTAFTKHGTRSRFFRIWHEPWPQTPIEIEMIDTSLLVRKWPWFGEAHLVGANYSPGAFGVWMGRPRNTILLS
jgi:uncharacterized protein YqjF (DUF2071 family)